MSTAPMIRQTSPGALYRGKGTFEFSVWAPFSMNVAVKIVSPEVRIISMERDERGYWKALAGGLFPGARYVFRLNDDKERPDPASRYQPEGVHSASELIDPDDFSWTDAGWYGIPLRDYIIYELHVGAFTPAGTFEAAINRLDYLKELGVTVIEIMPVAQFPGDRNWGYDGVYPYAPQNSYGGPRGLKKLVNACHEKGIAVILDVVYNHLGPDGNYLNDYGPYFTAKHKTPWGDAVNFDGPYSDEVRAYFTENALYWVTEYHIDALRLDAVDTIYDFGACHVLSEIAACVHRRADELERLIYVIAESDLNDVKLISPPEFGGYGLDAQWSDDFHHALHAFLTGERKGYYRDFGGLEQLEKAFREGFVYSGEYSEYRKRRHGNSSRDVEARRLVVCSQNHDQVGNRMLGERLTSLLSFEQLKLAASCVILSPFVPLLFMGEEYGEEAPFQYFVHHIDEQLIEAVREGRSLEFSHFEWNGDVPDPQDKKTFLRSRIDPDQRRSGRQKRLFEYYKALLHLRKTLPGLAALHKETMEVLRYAREQSLVVAGRDELNPVLLAFSFSKDPVELPVTLPGENWMKAIDSSSPQWGGTAGPAEPMPRQSGLTHLRLNPYSAVIVSLNREGR